MDWWKNKNGILQIYPRSYKDTNADGVGDIRGIIDKISYLKGSPDSLNIDAIWLSPFYPSPMADFGYDVADFCDVDPLFGTLDDFKELLRVAHSRDISVMIDLVPNHTSIEHPWFKEAVMDPSSAKRDYYIFRDLRDETLPNNWLSAFGGSAWTKEPHGDRYYLHSFLDKQPDLNWANPVVQEEFRKIVRFWCELGVDGFRLDAVNWLGKHPDLPDEPTNPDYTVDGHNPYDALSHPYSQSAPERDAYLRVITETAKEYPRVIMLFESYVHDASSEAMQLRRLYDVDPTVSAPFHFGGISAGKSPTQLAKTIGAAHQARDSRSAVIHCFGNHDKPRLASRVGADAARVVALIQLSLPGIPVVYYGDELGEINAVVDAEHVKDPFEKQVPHSGLGRDIARAPMQWNAEDSAGFTDAKTAWLPVATDYRDVNVQSESRDPDSFYRLYKKLLKLRSTYGVLRDGEYSQVFVNDEVYMFSVSLGDETVLVAANLSDRAQAFDLPEKGAVLARAKRPSEPEQPTTTSYEMEPWDAVIVHYDQPLVSRPGLYDVSR